jgi:hypothetical protein
VVGGNRKRNKEEKNKQKKVVLKNQIQKQVRVENQINIPNK